MVSPSLSVIIPVHFRREYLPSSLASVLAQGRPRSEYEIIVVKNFDDPELDSLIAEAGAVNLRTDAGPLGEKLELGVRRSTGGIVAFLEDDDLYLPGRLSTILGIFEDPKIGYFHNGIEVVDRLGAPLPGNYRHETRLARKLAPTERGSAAIRHFLESSPGFNLSAIAVRRDLLEPALPYLRRSNLTCDNLVLYAGLAAPLGLVNVGTLLTRYRLHRSASWGDADAEAFFEDERRRWSSLVEGFRAINEMLDGGVVGRFAECDLLEREAMYALASDPAEAPFSTAQWAGLVRCRLLRRELDFGRMALGLTLRSIAPKLEQRLYHEYMRDQRARIGVS